jgi:hypothetical protein
MVHDDIHVLRSLPSITKHCTTRYRFQRYGISTQGYVPQHAPAFHKLLKDVIICLYIY